MRRIYAIGLWVQRDRCRRGMRRLGDRTCESITADADVAGLVAKIQTCRRKNNCAGQLLSNLWTAILTPRYKLFDLSGQCALRRVLSSARTTCGRLPVHRAGRSFKYYLTLNQPQFSDVSPVRTHRDVLLTEAVNL